jgi:DNA-binding response OmpR family regulator
MPKQQHILIVEDEPSLSQALKAKCEQTGYLVTVAVNGRDGLERALADHPDFILLDIVMPVMDGVTMFKKLRQDAWGEKVPVLLLTNLNDTKYMEEGLKYNAVDYLVKTDWSLEEVVKQIKLKIG